MSQNDKLIRNIHVLLLFIFSLLFASKALSQENENYRLGPDDVISIVVFDEPDLSLKETRVSSHGTIALPLIGQVEIKGITVDEAEEKIKSLFLGDYLKKPDVTISVIEYRQFYVNGEVKKPGGYSYRKGMTVQRAITLAGGFSERASKSSITVRREGDDQGTKDVNLTSPIKPGDVITVEESFF